MPRGLYCHAPGAVSLRDYTHPSLAPREVRIGVEFASPKHGTLNHALAGNSPFATREFTRQRIFVPRTAPDLGLVGQWIGNAVVGRVIETGPEVTRVRPGDRVWAYGPIRETVDKREDDLFPMVPGLSDEGAVCVDPGHFALGAVRDARVSPGDRVVVTGLGAIGLFVVQMLARAGCDAIVAVDVKAERRALARTFGATHDVDPTTADVGLLTRDLFGDGADLAIEATGSYHALSAAIRSVGQCGRVVALGFYCGPGTPLELGAEAFHNRVDLLMSLPDWGNPLRDPRWDVERIRSTLTGWFVSGNLRTKGIVGPVVPLDEAAAAFAEAFHGRSSGVKLGVRLG
jgi:threonine dehydrogenase-like Zn-dependent dehydrogenase